jgi:hypothetical protein
MLSGTADCANGVSVFWEAGRDSPTRSSPDPDKETAITVKKLSPLVILAALAALVFTVGASVAASATLTFHVSPNPAQTGSVVTITGHYADSGGNPISGATVTLDRYDTANCSGPVGGSTVEVTNGSGDYSFSGLNGLPNGHYSFKATAATATSPCVAWTVGPVAAAAAPVHTSAMYLCYSKFEHDGGMVVDANAAADALKAGMWAPSAVKGNLPDGPGVENMGAYHLACNPDPSLKPTGNYVDNNGQVWDATYATSVGYVGVYPEVG